MPPLDATLAKKQILYVMDKQDGQGLRFVQLRVHSAKAKQLNDATGAPKQGHFKYTLVNETARVRVEKVRLRSGDYGIDRKWYLATTKPKKPVAAAAAAAAASKPVTAA
jgi:hypothetical protein